MHPAFATAPQFILCGRSDHRTILKYSSIVPKCAQVGQRAGSSVRNRVMVSTMVAVRDINVVTVALVVNCDLPMTKPIELSSLQPRTSTEPVVQEGLEENTLR